jgi:predicted dehydrogenase
MNVLHVYDHTEDPATAGFKRVLVTEPAHPYVGAWWPPGHLLGYEHGFTHQAVDLLTAIAEGRDPEPSFADGLAIQRVLAAVEQSAAKDSVWTEIPR